MSAGGALLLAHTVRFITGNVAGLCTLLAVGLSSMILDKTPGMFLMLALCVWAGVRAAPGLSLHILNLVPIIAVSVLLMIASSRVPVVGLFLANLIALVSLAYRGWINKRLLD